MALKSPAVETGQQAGGTKRSIWTNILTFTGKSTALELAKEYSSITLPSLKHKRFQISASRIARS